MEYAFLIDKLFHYSEVNTKCFDEGLPLTCLSIIIVNWNTELSLTSLLCLIHIIIVVKLRNAYSQNWKEILLAIVNYKNFKAVANNLKFVDSLFLFYHLHQIELCHRLFFNLFLFFFNYHLPSKSFTSHRWILSKNIDWLLIEDSTISFINIYNILCIIIRLTVRFIK